MKKGNWNVTIAVLLVLLFAAMPASAQRARISDHPGYVDFDDLIDRIDEEPTVEVNVKGALLNMAAEATRFEDESFHDVLSKLVAVRVYVYDLDDTRHRPRDFSSASREIADDLEEDGWDLLARVRDDDENVYVLTREDDDLRIQGLCVMVIDGDDEASYVNVVGEIDPADIGRIGRKFRIDSLEDLDW